jgi:hypothetical protein
MTEEPLFATVHQALTFAHQFSAGTLDRPMMLKMADRARPSGKGLGGLDGAAQAGLILLKVQELEPLHRDIIAARFLPREGQCHCCHQPVPAQDWLAAVRAISNAALTRGVLSGHLTNRSVRDGLVARYFGQKVHLQQLAARAGVHANTVSHHNALIVAWLRGTRYTKKGRIKEEGKVGQEQLAMDAIEARLLQAGIIESS